ncbi:hypothetical protein [Streptomyces sp. NPDC102283]|uniref:hypothetical protein n=1 Tax=Streptomyces sp. NPDC102283 TaxID=3366155 RepID=UPI00381AFFB0
MAREEFEQLKADAADQRSQRVQLNQVPPEPGGGDGSPQGDLAVNRTDLAAIGDAAFALRQDFGRVSERARAASTVLNDVARALAGELGCADEAALPVRVPEPANG